MTKHQKVTDHFECACDSCTNACRKKPGIFAPGEAEKAASLIGYSLQEFFDKFLAVDWWEPEPRLEELVFYLTPSIEQIEAGGLFPVQPNQGKCVLLSDDGDCSIHEAKPEECAALRCDKKPKDYMVNKIERVKAWIPHQDQIRELLGVDELERPEATMADLLNFVVTEMEKMEAR